MKYNVKVKEICLCGCGIEGTMIIELDNKLLKVYYQAPDDFIKEYLINKADTLPKRLLEFELLDNSKAVHPIDLWLVYGECKKVNSNEKKYSTSLSVSGGILNGEVISIISENEIRVDCGIIVDVDNESNINHLVTEGDFIEVKGTYQVYFSNTKFCK